MTSEVPSDPTTILIRPKESPGDRRQPRMAYQSTGDTVRVQLRSSKAGATDEESAQGDAAERRLILVGKSGGGKSATGNTLLGRKAFEAMVGAKTTTLRCQRGEGDLQGVKISVVDTPAMFDSRDYDEIVRREIAACVELSRPGPHTLILVTQVGRFTAEDATAAKCVWDIFGAGSARRTVVLFTCAEDLGGATLQEYVQKSDNRNLREVIGRCGNRFCGINNRAAGAEREGQVSALMETVRRTVSADGGGCYTNRLYETPDVRDEDVRAFLGQRKPHGERAARRPWRTGQIATVAVSCGFLVVLVIVIILLVRYL